MGSGVCGGVMEMISMDLEVEKVKVKIIQSNPTSGLFWPLGFWVLGQRKKIQYQIISYFTNNLPFKDWENRVI